MQTRGVQRTRHRFVSLQVIYGALATACSRKAQVDARSMPGRCLTRGSCRVDACPRSWNEMDAQQSDLDGYAGGWHGTLYHGTILEKRCF